jgi:hypothetical protein
VGTDWPAPLPLGLLAGVVVQPPTANPGVAARIRSGCGPLPFYEHLAARSQAEGVPRLALDGQPVDADWDPDLAPAMTALGVALHEEATLELLVADLSRRV